MKRTVRNLFHFTGILTLAAAWIVLALAFLSALAGDARGDQHWKNVPEGKKISGGVTLTWNLVKLPTRPKVTQRALIVRPEGKPRGAMVLFPGGDGASSTWKKTKNG